MIEWAIRFFLILTTIVTINSLYSMILYRRKKSVWRISLFTGIVVLCAIAMFLLWNSSQKIYSIPYGGYILKIMDSPFVAFFNYIPKWFIFIWFIVPVLIAWIFFLGKSGFTYEKIKKEYYNFVKKQQEKDAADKNKEKPEKAIETTDSVVSIANSNATEPAVTEKTEELIDLQEQTATKKAAEAKKMPPKQFFLEDSYPPTKFNYASLQGIHKAISHAKKELVLGKTKNGYVAVYATRNGYQKLKEIFSRNSIDITPLKATPSVVFFTYTKTNTYTIRNYVMKLEMKGSVNKVNDK